MLDPSIPWLAPGYKNFQNEDISKTQSYDDITKLYHVNNEDFIKKELRASNPELRQRRRVKSATIQRQLTRQSAGGDSRPPRPKTALGLSGFRRYGWRSNENSPTRPGSGASPGHSPTRPGSTSSYRERSRTRPGSSQSCYREKVGCYDYTSEHSLPESFIDRSSRPRPKSAILIRHRPSSLDRKSVSQVERQFHKERMTHSGSLEEGDHRCAFCPVECRSASSSSNRPTSSTGLVAVSVPTHFDRYTFWTRPRTAPSTKREFHQRPRHNYVNRGRVPHYTNFIKRINLDLRDKTPSPPPRVRKAFEEPVRPAPPREARESKPPRSQPPTPPKPDPPKEPPAPAEPVREPSPVVAPPVEEEEEEEEVIPPKAVSAAWTEPRAPTPTPTASPPPEPEEEERIPTPPPHREPTPPPPEEPKPEPEPEPPREPTPPPTPPREPTPPPREPTPPPREPTPPPREPTPPPPEEAPSPKPKKEVRIHDPPVTEPPPRKLLVKKKEKKAPSLVKRPSLIKKPDVKPEPVKAEPVKEPEPVTIKPIPVKKEEPKVVPKPVVVPSLPPAKPVEEPKPEPQEEVKPPEEAEEAKPEEEATDETDGGENKKQLGPPPQKVKVDIFGRSMDPEYMKQLLDLEMKSRRKGKSDDEDEDFEYTSYPQDADPIPDSAFKKSKLDSWLKGRMALSKRASRFELPMDVRDLEGMTPIAYLERYCIVNRRRAALYRRAFNKVDRDCDRVINQKEMEKAIEDALVDTVHLEEINYVLKLIEAEDGLKIKPKLFSAICALLERLFYHEFVTEDTAEMDGNSKERVETADFSALDWKLEGCTVNPPLKKLLYRLL